MDGWDGTFYDSLLRRLSWILFIHSASNVTAFVSCSYLISAIKYSLVQLPLV